MDGGMECLDPPVEDLGEAGDVGDTVHRDAGLLQCALGASGAEDLHGQPGQAPGEVDQARLVGNAQNSAHGSPPFEFRI